MKLQDRPTSRKGRKHSGKQKYDVITGFRTMYSRYDYPDLSELSAKSLGSAEDGRSLYLRAHLCLCGRAHGGQHEAFRLLSAAADMGSAEAVYELGVFHELAVPPAQHNLPHAAAMYLRAAELGYPEAMNRIGYCYENGIGVSPSPKRAHKWYFRGFSEGYAPAIFNLARLSALGLGTQADEAEALKLLQAAVQLRYPAAHYHLGTFFCDGKGGLSRDYKSAAAHMQEAVELGCAEAAEALAIAYERGDMGLEQSSEHAFSYFCIAARAGIPSAERSLSRCYRHGIGTKKRRLLAQKFRRLAEKHEEAGGRFGY